MITISPQKFRARNLIVIYIYIYLVKTYSHSIVNADWPRHLLIYRVAASSNTTKPTSFSGKKQWDHVHSKLYIHNFYKLPHSQNIYT